MANYDVIIVGSGFGGAVSACRLAEQGLKVLVLERGRRWLPQDYPRKPGDAWIWDEEQPERRNGWIDLRCMGKMWVAQGSGVGGGSLIYANVSIEAKPQLFAQGWPEEINYRELKPYYQRAGQMLNVQKLPENQLTERYKLMREGAEKLGYGKRFEPVELAVSFDSAWQPERAEEGFPTHSKAWINPQGKHQGTCIHCGNCDIGCEVQAKNTLDLNYLARAETKGAEIRPLHRVTHLSERHNGYQVHFERLENGVRSQGLETAQRVILASGSLGSTALLLRSRDQFRTLPKISASLGAGWSSNGDFLTPAFYADRSPSPVQGPTISCAIDFLDGQETGTRCYVEDGGMPNILNNYFQAVSKAWPWMGKKSTFLRNLQKFISAGDPLRRMMPWFGQAVDAADGRLYLGRQWSAPWKKVLKLDWDIEQSEAAIQGLIDLHLRLSEATGGRAFVPPTWTLLKSLVTPHPLGGCKMGNTGADGVTDHAGRVFGYRGLYVLDGAIIPRALGLNPSRTIAALAERNIEQLLAEEK